MGTQTRADGAATWLRRAGRRVRAAGRYWLDPRTRRPLILLAGVALAIFLAPLAADVAWAWFFGLPDWLRWSLGEAGLLAVIGLGLHRLMRVGPADGWPGGVAPGEPVAAGTAARLAPWALRLVGASLLVPILRGAGDGWGFADWDFVLDKFEALRRTILEWGEFPWWHPWCRGGFPLAAEPQIGAVSPATPLVLLFGTGTGLAIAAVACLSIALEGAYRLARLWLVDPWAAAAAALIFGLNGAVVVNTAWGYVLPMSYCSLPWLAWSACRIGGGRRDGVVLGAWAAFALHNGIQYCTLYGGLLAGLIVLRALRVQPAGRRGHVLGNLGIAAATVLALAGVRLATVLAVLRDDRREQITAWNESPWTQVHHLLARPAVDWPATIPAQHLADFAELTSYVGPVVVFLALASLRGGWRWWHTLTLMTSWLALGSTRWYHPSYWLSWWPFLASTHVVPRWRFVVLLGLGLAAGDALARCRRSPNRWLRAAAPVLTLVIGADLVVLANQQLPLAFGVPADPARLPGPPVPGIVNVRDGLGYPCVLRGYGVIRGYEPMVGGYRRDAPTLRRAREDADYRGEAWTDAGPIEPVTWSPNRIVFRVEPGQTVTVNQNPGSWWWCNGRPAFPGRRCAEPMVPFAVRADEAGRVDLRIHPRGLELGYALHAIGAVGLAVGWLSRSRRPRRDQAR